MEVASAVLAPRAGGARCTRFFSGVSCGFDRFGIFIVFTASWWHGLSTTDEYLQDAFLECVGMISHEAVNALARFVRHRAHWPGSHPARDPRARAVSTRAVKTETFARNTTIEST